jgi:FAD linked oxidases, C-terminal domain
MGLIVRPPRRPEVSTLGKRGAVLHGRGRAKADPAGRWAAAEIAVGHAIIGHGGTITPHHRVGTDHLAWMRQEIGDLGVEVQHAGEEGR